MTDDSPRDSSAPGTTLLEANSYLRDLLGPNVTALRPLRQGGWSSAFAFDLDGERCVARFSAWLDDFTNDRYAMRWNSRDLPVPAITHIGPAPSGYCAISRFIAGRPLDDLSADEMLATLPRLFAMLDALRTADLSGTSGFGGWTERGTAPFASWGDFLLAVAADTPDRRTYGWKAALATSSVGIERFNADYAVLQRLVERIPSPRHLIHSDLLNYNVLTDPPLITGVLDWGCGQFGDFLLDVAWFAHYWHFYPAWSAIDFLARYREHAGQIGLDLPGFDDRILACRLRIGLDDQAYNAYLRRWDEAERAATETHFLARQWLAEQNG